VIRDTAFGFAVLVWWTWPAIFVTVMLAVGAVVWLDRLADRRRDRSQGPSPCLAHVATTSTYDGRAREIWCLRKHGHLGMHTGPNGMAADEFRRAPEPDEQPGMDRWSPPAA